MRKTTTILTSFFKKRIYLLGILLFTCICVFFLLCPTFNYRVGNLFFGGAPRLYNVTLAQFFFKQAASPFFGKPAPYANHQLSRTYFIQGDLLTSIQIAFKELEIYPDHTSTYYIIGLTYGYMNQEQDAIEAFSKYIDTHPETWAARNDKAWLQFRIGDIDGALATIEPVATSTSINNPWVQNTYGTLLMNKKRYLKAKEAFARAETAASAMTEASWGIAYPGNDPRIYGTGLSAMRASIKSNQKLVEAKLMKGN
jgi:tetratricopeptide (TPR) repeat protein